MEICDQQVGARHKYGNSREQSLTLWNTVQQQYTEQNPLGIDRNLLDIIAERDAAIMEIRDQQVGGRHKYGNFSRKAVQQYNEQDLLGIDRNYLLDIIAERDAAIKERNQAFLEKKRAFEERRVAIAQRNLAIQECNVAVLERNNAVISLQQATIPEPIYCAVQNPTNRPTCSIGNQAQANSSYFKSEGMETLDALCKTMVASECPTVRSPRKRKHTGKINSHAIIPVPGCSCTGIFRRCYKWECGGWQSSCCTSTISAFPLPVMPHKRYRRICGRKMSGSVFSKLLSRLAVEGYDFSRPVDLKEHWSKHGTNLYTRIK